MTAPAPLDSLEIETHAAPNASILWLHGLGAHGSDFIEAIPELDLPASAELRFVFPHAPVIPVTCNGGYPMRAWYDILALDNSGRRIDAAGLFDNRAALRTLIAREQARGIPTRRILLAGGSVYGTTLRGLALRGELIPWLRRNPFLRRVVGGGWVRPDWGASSAAQVRAASRTMTILVFMILSLACRVSAWNWPGRCS